MTRVVANLCWMLPGAVGGSEEYATRLLGAVAAAPPDDLEVELAGPAALAEAHPGLVRAFPVHTFKGPASARPYRVAMESTWLPLQCRGAAVVHHLGGRLPALRSGRTVLTVHDLQPLDLPDNFSAVKRRYLSTVLPRSVRRADVVCTVSEWVAARMVERFGLDPAVVRVMPSTWDEAVMPVDDDPVVGSLGPGPVILYPAVTHPHKDHATLVRAAGRLADRHRGLQLVLTGGEGRAEDDLRRVAATAGRRLDIVRTGRIPASSVVSLLHRADVMAFPSTYEGFGLPVIEAMRLGTPVVAANATALPEVAGSAALLARVGDVDEWVDALDSVLSDRALRDRLVLEGTRRSEAFAPASGAQRLVSVWREATG